MRKLSAECLITMGPQYWFPPFSLEIKSFEYKHHDLFCRMLCLNFCTHSRRDYCAANIHSLNPLTLGGVHYLTPLTLGLAMWLASWLVEHTSLSSGCYYKIPKTGKFINHKNLFLTVPEAGSPRSECQHGQVVVEACCRLLTVSPHGKGSLWSLF